MNCPRVYSLRSKASTDANPRGLTILVDNCAAPQMPAFMKTLDPILLSKPFPLPIQFGADLLGSGRQSTIYWNHALTTSVTGELIVSFFSDNLTGNFTCNLQGISTEGRISGLTGFVVQQNLAVIIHP